MNDAISDSERGEHTFPGILSSSECNNKMLEIKKIIHSHKIAFWIFFGLFMIFMILTWVMFIVEIATEDHTLTIVYAVLCGVSIIGGIVNIVIANLSVRGIPSKKTLEFMINTNNQYVAFMAQGYDSKEAYKLTVEWIDRQNMNAEISRGARAISASIYLSSTINK